MNLPAFPLISEEPTEEPTPEPTTPSETTSPPTEPEPTSEPDSSDDPSTSEPSPTNDEPPENYSVLYEPTTSECGLMETAQDVCLHLDPTTVTFVGSGLLLLVLLLSALLASQLRRP